MTAATFLTGLAWFLQAIAVGCLAGGTVLLISANLRSVPTERWDELPPEHHNCRCETPTEDADGSR